MGKTCEALVSSSLLPLSVIIVGVGDEDFSDMQRLDGDNTRLAHHGVTAARDIVQFVGEFDSYNHSVDYSTSLIPSSI